MRCLPPVSDVWLGPCQCFRTGMCPLVRCFGLLLFLGLLVWPSRPRLWLLGFSFLFLIPGFPAVSDLGKELADAVDVCVGPHVVSSVACSNGILWCSYFSLFDVSAQGHAGNVEFLCCLTSRISLHLVSYATDSLSAVSSSFQGAYSGDQQR